MANKEINAKALCPFFITESKKSITCEGIIAEQNVTRFTSEEEKKAHQEQYCTKYYCENCKIYKALSEKYTQEKNERGGIAVKYEYKMP